MTSSLRTRVDQPVAEVWLIPTPSLSYAELHERYGHWLSHDENERLRLQRTPKGAYAFLLTRIALRAVLSLCVPSAEPAEWRFKRTKKGRPAVENIPGAPDFNLSHADEALVIAVASHGKLGVDIESLARQVADLGRLARRYFHQDEVAALMALPAEQQLPRFLTLWTLKEACVKATGQGLANALQEFCFRLDAPPIMQCPRFDRDSGSADQPGSRWRAWSGLMAPNHGGNFRLSLAWQLGADALAGEASLSFRQLRFIESVNGPGRNFVSEQLAAQWQPDWVYGRD